MYHRWGASKVRARGYGIKALFSGGPGTGKTMAAEVIAGTLGLDMFRVDLSSVVSRWVGETEKNLREIFDAAEGGAVVILFDEADSLLVLVVKSSKLLRPFCKSRGVLPLATSRSFGRVCDSNNKLSREY